MNTLLSLTLVLISLATAACRDSQKDHAIEAASEPRSLKPIYLALIAHELEHGQFPVSLSELVEDQTLKPDEILMRRLDGSLQIPDYFPDVKRGSDALLAFDQGDGIRVIVQVDGSARGANEN